MRADLTSPECTGVDAAERRQISDLMWRGDVDELDRRFPYRCCCYEHTFESCKARAWYACRGQGSAG